MLTVKTKVAEIQPLELNEIHSVHITLQLGAPSQPPCGLDFTAQPENN